MTSNTALSVTHWFANNPNNDGSSDPNENCMEINYFFGWNDDVCSVLKVYVCEMANE